MLWWLSCLTAIFVQLAHNLESDIAEMEEFIEYSKMLVNTLGHKVFEEKREFRPIKKQLLFYLKPARGAERKPISDGFVILKNAKASSLRELKKSACLR